MIFNVQPIKYTTFLFSRSVVSNSATLWTAACRASLSFTISQSLLKFTLSRWCLPTISSSIVPFCLCSFPASGGQSIGASASASVLPMNIQGWFPLGLPGLIMLSKKTLQSLLQLEGINFSAPSLFYCPALRSVHDYWKNHSFDCTDLCWPSNLPAF